MRENEIPDVSESLSRLVKLIKELVLQCHPDFRKATHKINYLRKEVSEYTDWSQTSIQQITSDGLSFNAFVAALHESIQNLKEISQIRRMNENAIGPRHASRQDTFVQQYGRRQKLVKKGPPRKFDLQERNMHGHTYEERRKRTQCHKCAGTWKPVHRCGKGSIRDNVRHCIKNGESSIHIMTELVDGLEGEIEGNRNSEADDGNGAACDVEANFGEVSELDIFHSIVGNEHDAMRTSFIESSDKEYFNNHFSASMPEMNEGSKYEASLDFQNGDEE